MRGAKARAAGGGGGALLMSRALCAQPKRGRLPPHTAINHYHRFLVVAAVGQLGKLLPHLDRLGAHELERGDGALGGQLGKLEVEVLVLEAAEVLDVARGRRVKDAVDARPFVFL